MPTTKVFGVIRGSGSRVIEKPAQRQIIPSPYGVVAWLGKLEKGPTNELIEVNSMNDFERRCGLRISDSELHPNADDFWNASRGRGKQFFTRVTDGTETKSSKAKKTRENGIFGFGRWRPALTITAKDGGRWAGSRWEVVGDVTGVGDLAATTIDTGVAYKLNEWAGGTLQMAELPGVTYNIISNTIAGIITIDSDATLAADWTASGGADNEYTLLRGNTDVYGNIKSCQVLYKDGSRDPTNEFGMEVFLNGVKILDYADLSLDSASDVYVIQVVNNDDANKEIDVAVNHTGAITRYTRPANQSGEIGAAALSTNVLTLDFAQTYNDAGNTGGLTSGGAGTFTGAANTQADVLTLTCNGIAVPGSETWTVESASQPDHVFVDATTAVAYVADNTYSIGFTITVGVAPWAVGDILTILVEPVIQDEPNGWRLYYDDVGLPNSFLEVYDSTPTTITVRPGNDLSSLTAVGKTYRLEYPETLERGYDGHAGVGDDDYIAALDLNTSQFKKMMNKKLGLIKYAAPGVNSTVTQKAIRAFAAANNGMYRMEITKTIVTEPSAISYVDTTMGSNDYQEVIWPSYYLREDPNGTGLITLCNTGMVQGVEAFFANTYEGYHKAAAGVDATLERIVQLPTKDLIQDNENTNPRGIQVILKKEGNFVIWGDRIPASTSGIGWKHKREQLSHYERVLIENFDYIIFGLNDKEERNPLISAVKGYFLPEWQPKRAIRGDTFEDAARIQCDDGNNNDATMAVGDMNMEITLRLADVIDKLKIVVSQAGITETV